MIKCQFCGRMSATFFYVARDIATPYSKYLVVAVCSDHKYATKMDTVYKQVSREEYGMASIMTS